MLRLPTSLTRSYIYYCTLQQLENVYFGLTLDPDMASRTRVEESSSTYTHLGVSDMKSKKTNDAEVSHATNTGIRCQCCPPERR